jgi:hypothetical protein
VLDYEVSGEQTTQGLRRLRGALLAIHGSRVSLLINDLRTRRPQTAILTAGRTFLPSNGSGQLPPPPGGILTPSPVISAGQGGQTPEIQSQKSLYIWIVIILGALALTGLGGLIYLTKVSADCSYRFSLKRRTQFREPPQVQDRRLQL